MRKMTMKVTGNN